MRGLEIGVLSKGIKRGREERKMGEVGSVRVGKEGKSKVVGSAVITNCI